MARAWLLVVLVAPLGALAPAGAGAPPDPAEAALAWLGTFHGKLGYRPEYVVEAVAQTDHDPRTWPAPSASAFSLMRPTTGGSALTQYMSRVRIAHAVGTSGYDPRDVGGHDYVADARASYVGAQADVLDDAWLILALRAAGVDADDDQIQRAALVLEAARGPSGGWGITATSAPGTDTTAMVLVALAAAERDVVGDERARRYLDSTRDPATGGHFDATSDAKPNCQSTVWALHAYDALGISPRTDTLAFFASLQDTDGRIRRHANERDDPNDAWCTAEAIVYLAGGRYPLPGYAPGTLALPRPHALEPTALRVQGPFTRALWTIGEERATGLLVTRTYPERGPAPLAVLAEGDGTRWRASGVVDVLSARPRVALDVASIETLRNETVTLSVSAEDPDGTIASVDFDWGDGARTTVAEHAYTRPGTFEVHARARDDSGYWSDAATATVSVVNRAPAFAALPARHLADRVAPVELGLRATDPDGDPVTIRWRLADATGEGDVRATLSTLGEHALVATARDVHGAEAHANVTIDVLNVPPSIELTLPAEARANETLRLVARTADPDGPAPRVEWTVGDAEGNGTSFDVVLEPGAHRVVARAVDADGEAREATATLVVTDAAEPSTPSARPIAPRVRHASVEAVPWGLRVRLDVEPPGATTMLVWAHGDRAVEDGDVVPWPEGAAEVSGTLLARHEGLTAETPWGPLRRAAPALPPLSFERPEYDATAGVRLGLVLQPHEAAEYRFDLGDGWTAWDALPEAAAVWATPGAREVRAQARDGERVVEARAVVRVAPAPEDAPLSPASLPMPARDEPLASRVTEAPAEPAQVPVAPAAALVAMAIAARLGTRARSGRR